MNCDARGPMCCPECGARQQPRRCSLPSPSRLHPCSCLPSLPLSAFSRLPSSPHLSSPLNIFLSLCYHAPSSCLICFLRLLLSPRSLFPLQLVFPSLIVRLPLLSVFCDPSVPPAHHLHHTDAQGFPCLSLTACKSAFLLSCARVYVYTCAHVCACECVHTHAVLRRN